MAELTERQAQVLQLKAEGLTDKEVGFRLGITPDRVQQHCLAIRRIASNEMGRNYVNLIGAAFALQLAGLFEFDESSALTRKGDAS